MKFKILALVSMGLLTVGCAHQKEGHPAPDRRISSVRPTTTEGASMFCAIEGDKENMGFAFDFELERAWFAGKGEKEGLEMKVDKLQRLRCPGCFDIKAKLMGDKYKFVLRGNGSFGKEIDFNVTVDGQGSTGRKQTQELKGKCAII